MTDVTLLTQIKTALLTALLADAARPFGTYSIDGQSVSRDRFRQWVLDAISTINQLIQAEDPYEIRTSVL
jgi:hypothetical protein